MYHSLNLRSEADAFTVKRIQEAYARLQKSEDCHSLLKKYLTNDVLDKLKYRKTRLGATLYDVIRSGKRSLSSVLLITGLSYRCI